MKVVPGPAQPSNRRRRWVVVGVLVLTGVAAFVVARRFLPIVKVTDLRDVRPR